MKTFRKEGSWRAAAIGLLMMCVSAPAISQTPAISYLDQGWTADQRNLFYTTSQGSQMIPYDWYRALERPNSEVLFGADSLTRFGYLANASATGNPDQLPVGFVVDQANSGNWLGMTCAACHTNQLTYGGQTFQIDGAPTDADMWALISEMGSSLTQTTASQSDPKFKRFLARIRAQGADAGNISEKKLFKDLKAFSTYFTKYVAASKSVVPWGRARLDAFGMIFNRATAIDLNDPRNNASPNAPVSYPFLWDTHWHDKVQWNGSAPNNLIVERLGRNVGEVLGVFAHTDIKETILPPLFFRTSALRLNQLMLEETLLSKLRSPAWPASFPAIDADKAAAGAALYQTNCVSCHALTPRNQPLTRMNVVMTPLPEIGTDPMMVRNAASRMAWTGILEGVRMPFPFASPMAEKITSLELTGKITIGAILAPPDWGAAPTEVSTEVQALLDAMKAELKPANPLAAVAKASALANSLSNMVEKNKSSAVTLAYKARPLDGIWATAPYLHNGSVPNLYQLLLPAKDRVKKFFVGSREFDPVNVGFTFTEQPGTSLLDTSLKGNSNAGHDTYGVFTETQRWQLVEYLKTL
jgi:hypothetical protein